MNSHLAAACPGRRRPLAQAATELFATWLQWAALAGSVALVPGAALAAPNDAELVRYAATQMQDLGAMLRPQPRRAAVGPPLPPLQLALLTPRADSTSAAPGRDSAGAQPVLAVTAITATPAATVLPDVKPMAMAMTMAVVVPVPPPAAAPAPAPVAAAPAPAAQARPTLLAANTVAPAPALVVAAAPAAEPRFDLAVNNAPAAQVFLQLAQGTHYNMLVSPDVSGMLSISLKDTTVPEAMDTLRELFGYDFRITGKRIFVYANTVQTRLYKVNYLPGRRQGASDIRVSSSAITTAGGTGGTGGSNTGTGNTSNGGGRPNDSAHVHTTSDADFWHEVQASLAAMVGTAGGRNVVLNPAAGVVVVKATPAELRQVENYLKAVQLSIERQVMLEAKIVEVQLSRDSQTGINWSGFGRVGGKGGQLSIGSTAAGTKLGTTGSLSSNDGTVISPGVDLAAGALGRGFYGLAFQAANFAALLNFLQTQGDVQVLSSPRIATLNNQKAVLKVGSDELYVTGVSTSSSTNAAGASTASTPTLTLQPFFSGISLDVTPQIDDAGNVMLHVHPTISTVTEKNKNIDLGSLGSFRLPLAASSVNETDSIVRVRDGQIVAIGGLMRQEIRDERTGLPVLADAPVFGGLFRQTSTVLSKRELVIMLKPTVIQHDGPWPDAPSIGLPGAALAPLGGTR